MATGNGKIEYAIEDDKWMGRLIASNGELLFMTSTYSSRTALVNGLKNIEEKAMASNISVCKTKSDMFQFKVFADNGMVLVIGEMYPTREGARKAAISMRNFFKGGPKIIDLTKKGE